MGLAIVGICHSAWAQDRTISHDTYRDFQRGFSPGQMTPRLETQGVVRAMPETGLERLKPTFEQAAPGRNHRLYAAPGMLYGTVIRENGDRELWRNPLAGSGTTAPNWSPWGAMPQAHTNYSILWAHESLWTLGDDAGVLALYRADPEVPGVWKSIARSARTTPQAQLFMLPDGYFHIFNGPVHFIGMPGISAQTITWGEKPNAGASAEGTHQWDSLPDPTQHGTALFGEFQLGGPSLLKRLEWNPEDGYPAAIVLRYRCTTLDEPYGNWSSYYRSSPLALNTHAAGLQYQIVFPKSYLQDLSLAEVKLTYLAEHREEDALVAASGAQTSAGGGQGDAAGSQSKGSKSSRADRSASSTGEQTAAAQDNPPVNPADSGAAPGEAALTSSDQGSGALSAAAENPPAVALSPPIDTGAPSTGMINTAEGGNPGAGGGNPSVGSGTTPAGSGNPERSEREDTDPDAPHVSPDTDGGPEKADPATGLQNRNSSSSGSPSGAAGQRNPPAPSNPSLAANQGSNFGSPLGHADSQRRIAALDGNTISPKDRFTDLDKNESTTGLYAKEPQSNQEKLEPLGGTGGSQSGSDAGHGGGIAGTGGGGGSAGGSGNGSPDSRKKQDESLAAESALQPIPEAGTEVRAVTPGAEMTDWVDPLRQRESGSFWDILWYLVLGIPIGFGIPLLLVLKKRRAMPQQDLFPAYSPGGTKMESEPIGRGRPLSLDRGEGRSSEWRFSSPAETGTASTPANPIETDLPDAMQAASTADSETVRRSSKVDSPLKVQARSAQTKTRFSPKPDSSAEEKQNPSLDHRDFQADHSERGEARDIRSGKLPFHGVIQKKQGRDTT